MTTTCSDTTLLARGYVHYWKSGISYNLTAKFALFLQMWILCIIVTIRIRISISIRYRYRYFWNVKYV